MIKMRKVNQVKIGKKIKKLRQNKGLTQRELAQKLELTTRHVSDIEQDRSKASYDVLIQMCKLFEISMDTLFSDYIEVQQIQEQQQYLEKAINYLNKIKC